MALIIGDSDSGILGMGVFAVIFLAVYIRHSEKLRRYLLALSVMSGSVLILRGVCVMSGGGYKQLGELTSALLFSNALFAVFAALAAVTALLTVFKDKLPKKAMPKAVPIAILSLLGAAVLSLLGALLYFTLIDVKTDLGSAEKLLRLNDAWGTHRGIMWLRSFRIFADAPWYQKLFGTGPDTFFYAFQPYFGELENYGNSSTDAAHNEYLNYLITIGVFGLGSYLTFIGSALIRAVRARKQNPIVMVFAGAVIAYAVQAVVNIAVPISAPLFIIFVSLCCVKAAQLPSSDKID
jgi:O-antigen ligase